MCLPPHSSAHFQPLDAAVFAEVKKIWKVNLDSFYKKTRAESVTKQCFPMLIKALYEKAFKPQHATAGFYKTGLYPWDPSRVQKNRELVGLGAPLQELVELDEQPANISKSPKSLQTTTTIARVIEILIPTAGELSVQPDSLLSPIEKASQNLASTLLKHLSFSKEKKNSTRKGIDVGGKCLTGNC